MFYVYVLKSGKNSDIYVGYTKDLKERLKNHNQGKVRSTKFYRPWKLAYYEAYATKPDAILREKELKQHAAKNALLKRLKFSLKIHDLVAKW